MKNPTIIFRTTSACNLNCTYCYDKLNKLDYNNEDAYFKENIGNILKYINNILVNKNETSKIIFHGGEPLLIKPNTYRILLDGILKENPNIKFSIQTNGTLINKEFIELFKKYKINVGVSLDGCNEEQNHCRVYRNGKNSFYKVLSNIKYLQENRVRTGVIMTVSKECIGHEEELYNFIADNKLNCNIRPAFGDNKEIVMNNNEYYNFFTKMFKLWLDDTESRVKLNQITEIYEEFYKAIKGTKRYKVCSETCNCFTNYISLDVNGNLYSCNRTYNNNKFYYGNLNRVNYSKIQKKMRECNDKRKKFIDNSKCIKCSLYNECKGGCPANAYSKNNMIESIDDYFCEAKIKIKRYIMNIIEEKELIKQYKGN